jgi:hypothetical protein
MHLFFGGGGREGEGIIFDKKAVIKIIYLIGIEISTQIVNKKLNVKFCWRSCFPKYLPNSSCKSRNISGGGHQAFQADFCDGSKSYSYW